MFKVAKNSDWLRKFTRILIIIPIHCLPTCNILAWVKIKLSLPTFIYFTKYSNKEMTQFHHELKSGFFHSEKQILCLSLFRPVGIAHSGGSLERVLWLKASVTPHMEAWSERSLSTIPVPTNKRDLEVCPETVINPARVRELQQPSFYLLRLLTGDFTATNR